MNILKLPISITNWIILSDSVKFCTDKRVYIKIFSEYLIFLPIYKIEEVCKAAETNLMESDFQLVLDTLWKYVSVLRQEEGYR